MRQAVRLKQGRRSPGSDTQNDTAAWQKAGYPPAQSSARAGGRADVSTEKVDTKSGWSARFRARGELRFLLAHRFLRCARCQARSRTR